MKTVLVVDAADDIRLLLRLELAAAGYDVVTASDGTEARDRITSLRPDVVLLDVLLPEVDGWTLLRELPEPKPAIIVITGLVTDRDAQYRRAVELGALGYVSKPFDSEQLTQLVHTAATLDADERAAFRDWLLAGGAVGGSLAPDGD